ncbi:hypothetical protein MWH25_08185 [Natroniella acetigena]|uniref:hypothetical protein n=1 Tax=Natroniella acetigena TaxID=52004 RepID=UPI00200A1737|nr:hypothetical protein [Natroniella acetigena]MCK8827721.1 hypothetical protein [Natroniella acetigena]
MTQKETKVIRCTGEKNDGSRCTREKEVPVDFVGPWHCWQHPPEGQNNNKQGVGHKLAQEKIEQIKVDLQVYTSINYIAKRNNVSWETVKRIKEEYKDDIEKYRDEKKKEFADRAWEEVMKALQIGNMKLDTALEQGQDIKDTIDKILALVGEGELKFKEAKQLIKPLAALSDYSLRDLSIFIGTLVDKHELVTGGPTERTENDHNHNLNPIDAILQADEEIEGDKDGEG